VVFVVFVCVDPRIFGSNPGPPVDSSTQQLAGQPPGSVARHLVIVGSAKTRGSCVRQTDRPDVANKEKLCREYDVVYTLCSASSLSGSERITSLEEATVLA